MNREATTKRWQPTATTWLAGSLVIGGSVLAVLFGAWFLLLAALEHSGRVCCEKPVGSATRMSCSCGLRIAPVTTPM